MVALAGNATGVGGVGEDLTDGRERRAGAGVRLAGDVAVVGIVIGVGAMLAASLTETGLGRSMGLLAVILASVNVFGGFLVTRRMLEMFKKKEPRKAENKA